MMHIDRSYYLTPNGDISNACKVPMGSLAVCAEGRFARLTRLFADDRV